MICKRCTRTIPDDANLCCYCGYTYHRPKPSRVHQRANGTGTAYKRGKTWTAEVVIGWKKDETGKRHKVKRTKGGFQTRTDALDFCKSLYMVPEIAKTAPPLSEYWEIYSSGEMTRLSDSKQTAYKIAWKRMKDIMFRPIDTLTVKDLRQCVDSSTSTYYPARDMKSLLSHLFTLAAADRKASKDVPEFIILPEKNEKERLPFTVEEQKSIWKAYESGVSDAAIPLIMIYTGMMTGEMRMLSIENIDIENQRITGLGLKTKIRKESPIYIPDEIVPVIQDAMEGKKDRLWTCNEDDFYERYYAALEAAGARRLTPYSCRHTTATALAIDENIAPETVRKVMRWTTTAMLSRYAHPDDADAIAAVNRINPKK